MNHLLRISIIIALVFYFVCIFYMLRRKRFALKYTLLWLFAGVVMVLVVIFPRQFETLIHLIGIVDATNGLFAVVLFALIIFLVSITAIVTKLNEGVRTLVQKCAMYEKRIRELEQEHERERETANVG